MKSWLTYAVLVALLICGCASKPPEKAPVVSYVEKNFGLPHKPVVVLLLDGVNADVFYEMLDAGELPNIQEYIADRGCSSRFAFCALTSDTFPTTISLLTGRTPPHLDMPSNNWFDRRDMIHRIHNSDAGRNALRSDVGCNTIYEMLSPEWTAAVSDTFIRGTSYHNRHINWLGICYFMKRWKIMDRISIETFDEILRQANERGTFPQFTFVHLIGTDCWGHMYGPYSPQMRDMLKHEDKHIGRLMRTFDALGFMDDLCIVLMSDHGMEPILPEKVVDLEDFLSDYLHIPATKGKWEGPITDKARVKLMKYRAICLPSGDRAAFLYFDNPTNDRRLAGTWTDKPTLAQLCMFRNNYNQEIDIVEQLRRLPGVGLVCAKDGEQCRVYSAEGEAAITRDAGNRYAYEVVSGSDPLQCGRGRRATMDTAGWFEQTKKREFPGAVPQIYDLFDSERTGDIVVFADAATNFQEKLAGAHGGTRRAELRVPFLIAGPGIKQGEGPIVRVVDVLPTLLDYMERTDLLAEAGDMDGHSVLPDMKTE